MAGRPKMVRPWPLQPLLDAAGVTVENVAHRCNTSRAEADRALTRGLTDIVADRWALRLNLMPHEVWPGWFDNAAGPAGGNHDDQRGAENG